MTRKQAVAFRKLVELGSMSLTDKDMSTAPDVLPRMTYSGELITNRTRINQGGAIKRAAVDLYDTELNNPDNAPNLWEDVLYRDGIRIIPDVITVGLAFAKDEQGWWGDVLYRSKMDNNVWAPDGYPAGWEKV